MPVNPIIDVGHFHDAVSINRGKMDEEFCNQAGHYAYYSARHFEAMKQSANLKLIRDVKTAQVSLEVRQSVADEIALHSGDKAYKKPTEGEIESRVNTDSRVVIAVREYNEAKAIEELAGNCLDAFRHKKDMLIGLGCNDREERRGELRMRAEPRGAGDVNGRVA